MQVSTFKRQSVKESNITKPFTSGGTLQLFYWCHYSLGPEHQLDSQIDQLEYYDQLEHNDHGPCCSLLEDSFWIAKPQNSESLQHSQQHSWRAVGWLVCSRQGLLFQAEKISTAAFRKPLQPSSSSGLVLWFKWLTAALECQVCLQKYLKTNCSTGSVISTKYLNLKIIDGWFFQLCDWICIKPFYRVIVVELWLKIPFWPHNVLRRLFAEQSSSKSGRRWLSLVPWWDQAWSATP